MEVHRRARRWGRCLAFKSRREDGATLIEVIVAVFILALIVTPTARLVIETGAAANQDRVRVEATNLATQVLENELNNSFFGVIQPGDTYTPGVKVTENGVGSNGKSRTELFNVTVSYQVVTATNQSVCASNGGTIPSQIYVATAKVDWTGDGGAPVIQTTLIAPEQAGAAPSAAGEIAVPVDAAAAGGALSSNPYTASAIPVTVAGVWTGGGSPPSVPNNEVTYATSDTGNTGCAVFTNLDPQTGWSYDVYLGTGNGAGQPPSNQASVVTNQEYPGIVNGSVLTVPLGSPTLGAALSGAEETVSSLTVGTATVAPTFYVDPGVSVTVLKFLTDKFPAITPAPNLPVTVQANPQLQGQNSAFSFDTVARGTAISSLTVWPYSDYFFWSGDTNDSYPLYTPSGGSQDYPGATVPGFDATGPGPFVITVPVYPAVFSDATAPAGVQLTVTNVSAPGESFTLNPFDPVTHNSSTGVPLGEYTLGATGGHGVTSPLFIWVTNSGVYYGPTVASQPSAMPNNKPEGTAVPVVIS